MHQITNILYANAKGGSMLAATASTVASEAIAVAQDARAAPKPGEIRKWEYEDFAPATAAALTLALGGTEEDVASAGHMTSYTIQYNHEPHVKPEEEAELTLGVAAGDAPEDAKSIDHQNDEEKTESAFDPNVGTTINTKVDNSYKDDATEAHDGRFQPRFGTTLDVGRVASAVKDGWNESQSDSAARRKEGWISSRDYTQEGLDNWARIDAGTANPVFKTAAKVTEVIGGVGRDLVDQAQQFMANAIPGDRAALDAVMSGLGEVINQTVPGLQTGREYVLNQFPTENSKFVVDVLGGALLGGGARLTLARQSVVAAPRVAAATNATDVAAKVTAVKTFASKHSWPELKKAVMHLPEDFNFLKYATGGKTIGVEFRKGNDTITIKKAKPDADYPSQRVDYVSYTKH